MSLQLHVLCTSSGRGVTVALHREGFAWVPDLRNFLKLREIGVSPYLGFILYLSVFMMLELNEAVRGRLIGPKSWYRIVIIFETQMEQPVTVHGLIWVDSLCIMC